MSFTVFRSDIEGLRALAVVAVVLFHAGVPGFGGGFVGVDVFFVISGYLITGLLVREYEGRGRLDLQAFYARRAARLLPAHAVMSLATMAASFWLLAPAEQQRVASAGAATGVYLSNAYFAWRLGDYFGPAAETNPYLHTWSLAVEEQFYLVWPLVIALVLLARRQSRVIGALSVLAATSLALCLVTTTIAPKYSFYLTPFRAWQFAAGGLACLMPAVGQRWWEGGDPDARWGPVFGWTGLVAVLGSILLIGDDAPFPGPQALVPTLGTALLLKAGETRWRPPVLTHAVSRWVGAHSYSWYLWHWPALVLGRAWLLRAPDPLSDVAFVTVALGLAAASERLVERPTRHHPRLRGTGGLVVAVGLPVVLLGIGIGWHTAAERVRRPDLDQFHEKDARLVQREGCIGRTGSAPEVHTCKVNPGGTRSVVAFGDSHMDHFVPMLEEAAVDLDWEVSTFLRTSCSPVPFPTRYVEKLKILDDTCPVWREEAIRQIRALHPDAIVIATRIQDWADLEGVWRRGIEDLLTIAPVIVIADVPAGAFEAPSCMERTFWRGLDPTQTCFFEVSSSQREAQDRVRAVVESTEARWIEVFDPTCMDAPCPVWEDGVLRYRDDHHLASRYSRSLAPRFITAIRDGALAAPGTP